jgi:hypothetical protein
MASLPGMKFWRSTRQLDPSKGIWYKGGQLGPLFHWRLVMEIKNKFKDKFSKCVFPSQYISSIEINNYQCDFLYSSDSMLKIKRQTADIFQALSNSDFPFYRTLRRIHTDLVEE